MRTHRLCARVAVATLLTVTGAVAAGATSLIALTGHRTLLTIDYRKPAVVRHFTSPEFSGRLLGIDVLLVDGVLYGIVDNGAVVTIDPRRNGKAQFKSQFTQTLLSGVRASVDFNPSADRLRIIGSDGTNLRANVDDGAALLDTPLSFAPGPFVPVTTPPTLPKVIAAAYTNSAIGTLPAAMAVLFDVDDVSDVLYAQVPANGGVLNAVGSRLGISPGEIGFDIATHPNGTNMPFLISGNRLYRPGLLDGRVGKGTLVKGLNAPVRDLAVLTISSGGCGMRPVWPHPLRHAASGGDNSRPAARR